MGPTLERRSGIDRNGGEVPARFGEEEVHDEESATAKVVEPHSLAATEGNGHVRDCGLSASKGLSRESAVTIKVKWQWVQTKIYI